MPNSDSSPAQQAAAAFLVSQGHAPALAPEIKPVVLVPGGRISNTQSAQSLFEAIAPKRELFYRGGAVMELVNEGNGHSIEELKPAAAQSRFEKYVDFCKAGATVNDPATPTTISKAQAEMYLSSAQCHDLLPKLNGIIRFPLLVENGNALRLLANGYDDQTGFYVESAKEPEEMDLNTAVAFITGLLDEFDFLTPGDRSRAIASMLTPAMKLSGLITGPIPVDVAEADASQSGKTFRQKMVAALYNQNVAVVTKKGSGVGGMEETFSDHLVKGHTFIQFDNVRGKLDSQLLESFLTSSSSFHARIPYSQLIKIDPSKFIIFISSNGFEATKDLTNRASIIRIKKREGYQFRTDNGKDALGMMYELQHVWYGAVLAVINAWHEQGKQRTNDTRHDFREWCQVMDWIVQNIFQAAPLMDDHAEAKERAASPQLTFLRVLAIAVRDDHRLDQLLSATQLMNLCIEKEITIPGLGDDKQADTDAGKKQMGTIMGKLFGRRNELTIEDFRVAKSEESATTDQGNTQTLRKYRFNLIFQPNPPSTSPTQTPGPIPTAPPAQVDRTGIPQNPIKSQ
jgi:hypothetical protein